MTKRGLPHSEHLRLGQVLSGVRNQLVHEQTGLMNAYPRTGPRALPAEQLQVAIDALDETRMALEKAVFDEHPEVAETHDYYPYEEHRAELVVPGKPGSRPSRVRFGRQEP
ncbi:hypothetical protein [Streptomyces canus]|uniref:hypothetical protein n=1 Tax=Streptomyces canus TaxID=58343 RepID=UPI0033A97BD0